MGYRRDTFDWFPGNTIMSQRAFDEHVMSVGRGWLEFCRVLRQGQSEGLDVTRIAIKDVNTPDAGVLVILTARMEGEPVVGFHNVDDLATIWQGLANRIRNGRMKWKVDEYAK